jgi:hypothetical protein
MWWVYTIYQIGHVPRALDILVLLDPHVLKTLAQVHCSLTRRLYNYNLCISPYLIPNNAGLQFPVT